MEKMRDMRSPWALNVDEVLQECNSSTKGLTSIDAAKRLDLVGPNALVSKNQEPWYKILVLQFANPLVYILIGAAILKAVAKGLVDALVIVLVLLFMAIIGFVQEMKARKAMEGLLKLGAPRAKVRRDGLGALIDASGVVPGDILLLDAGDRIAADGRIIESANLRINESLLTGESLPVEKSVKPVHGSAMIHDRKNMVFMGTTVSYGRALAVVTAIGMRTEIGQIAASVQNTMKEETPLQKNVKELGHSLIWIVLAACILIGAVGLINGMPWIDVVLLAVAAAVSGIPEGLPAAVTVVLAICVGNMARRNVIIRKLMAVETLGAATVICTDKTGTLTVNEMTVRDIWCAGHFLNVTGSGYEPAGEILQSGKAVLPGHNVTLEKLLRIASLCNDAILSQSNNTWSILGDPTEGALITASAKLGLWKKDLDALHPRLDEIPFDSQEQFMATLHCDSGQRTAYVKGSVERVLPMCSGIELVEGQRPLDTDARERILRVNKLMADKALRVLAVATAPYPIELGKLNADSLSGRLVLVGLVGMMDPPREEARRAIEACKGAGIRVIMITGDDPNTAVAIASQIGISSREEVGITSKDIERLDQEHLTKICRTHNVFARIEPLHKLRIVDALKRDNQIVAMTGDGVNDAPALEAANIGISMGITGTDVAKEASDMVLVDDNFKSIVSAVEEGRIVFNQLRNVTFFLLMTCFAEVLTLFLSVLLYGEPPLEPIQILWINLVTGAMVAIPLGLEKGTGTELLQPPRHSRVGLVFPGMLYRLAFVAACMGILVVWLFHHAPLPAGVDGQTAHEIRQTVAFTSIVVFEWLFAFHARSSESGVLRMGLFRNPWLIICMFIGLSLQMMVVYLPSANALFHTHPLTGMELLWVLFPGIIAVFLEGARKSLLPNLFSKGQWTKA